MSEKKNYHHIVNNLNNFCFQKKSNIHLTFHFHRISLFLKFHDETSSFFFPLPIFCYDRHTSYIPPPPPSRCLASDFGYYVAENRRCCKSDDVRNSRERGIDWNRGTHTHTHMYTHIYTHGERRVTGSRASSTLYINSHRPGKPPIGVRTVKLLPDNGPRSHLRETEIWICFALPASTPRKCSINKQFWRKFDSCVRIILSRQYFIAKFRHLCLLVEDRYICIYI